MKKIYLYVICVCILLIFIIPHNCFALSDIITSARDFIQEGASQTVPMGNLSDGIKQLLQIAVDIGYIVALGVGLYLSYKMFVSSADEKAKTKELLIAYIIGVIVIFGAVKILSLVYGIFAKLAN